MGKQFTLDKSERLSDVRLIDAIFQKKGKSIFNHPILLVYLETSLNSSVPAQVLISVSKKKFIRAHDRNRIRRQLREIYRLNKYKLYDVLQSQEKQVAIALIYLENNFLPYTELEKQVNLAIDEFVKRYS